MNQNTKIIITVITILVCIFIVIFNHNRMIRRDNIKIQKNKKQIEAMSNNIDFSPNSSFCRIYSKTPANLEHACKGLTSVNCKTMDCCVLVNNTKCAAGGINGPTYKSNDSGQPMQIDSYYYKNKCYVSKFSN